MTVGAPGNRQKPLRPLAEVIQHFTWLEVLPSDLRDRVISDMRDSWVRAGSVVAHRGDPSCSWVGVVEGLLKVSSVNRDGKVVMFAGIPAGSWVGEGSVLKQEPRKYDVWALRDSHIVHLPGATFRWLQSHSLEFNRVLVERLNARLGQYIGMMEIDRLSDPVARIARCIASLFCPVLYPRMDSWLQLSQFELSELVGLSRTTISFGLHQLELEGLVSTQYGRVQVHDLAALQRYEGMTSRHPLRRLPGRNSTRSPS